MSGKGYTLGDLAERIGAQAIGDKNLKITGTGSLGRAAANTITFSVKPGYRHLLRDNKDIAVIVKEKDYSDCGAAALICDDPYLAFARVSQLFKRTPATYAAHPTATVAATAQVGKANIGAYCVIEDHCIIGDGAEIDHHCVVMANSKVGRDSHLFAHVTLYHGTEVGERSIIHSGAVIGADGFGVAEAPDKSWVKIEQSGSVRIGNDVEIGAGTTIDCATFDETVIEDGVKIDNQVQIAHNVTIGAHTAIAGCTCIAGSAKIGRYCRIGGQSGINGHIAICDNVVIMGGSWVPQSIGQPGAYGGVPLQERKLALKNLAIYKKLYKLFGEKSESIQKGGKK